jgi:hypothetical protein
MKRTVVLALALVFVVGSAFIVTAQKKVVDAKQLQGLLPGAPEGFKVDEPASGSIGSTPFGRISSAEVSYKTAGEVPRMIHVTITDLAEHTMARALVLQIVQPASGQSENGYEKSVVVKGEYRGSEEANAMMSTCAVSFVVGDRFVVTAEGIRVDVKILYSVLDAMSVETLGKLI